MIKIKSLFIPMICLLPMIASAAVPYRVEQTSAMTSDEMYAALHRFYIYGAYDYSMWQSYTDDANVHASGKNTSSFEGAIGARLFDTFRLEANYVRTDAKWSEFSMTGNSVFLNAIFDARIGSMYRAFRSQHIVPYVGIGGGASWNDCDDMDMSKKVSPVVSGLAGLSIEFGEHFAFDFGYRYFYMFSPNFNGIDNLRPNAHQFRGGIRINF